MSIYKNEKPEYLRLALDSILQQTVKPNEIVIVKDGVLTAQLDAVLDEYKAKYPIIRLLAFNQNRGLGLALRDGVKACKYEWIARMDTDDVSKPDRFEKQIEYLSNHQDIALLGTAIEEFNSNINKPDTKTILPLTHSEIVSFAKMRNPFRHVTVFFRKSAAVDSGNYGDFLWLEDYDLFIRMINKGYKTANLPDILVSVRADEEMFARRGGWKYLKQDVKFQKFLLKINYINLVQFGINVTIRSIVRIIPNKLRKLFYEKLLRK